MPNVKRLKSRSKPKKTNILKESAKKMETVLQEGPEIFAKLITVVPDVVIITDPQGKIIYVNDIALQTLGYSHAGEAMGKQVVDFIDLQYRNKAERHLKRLLEDGGFGPNEYMLIAKDGSRIPFEFNGNHITDSDGLPVARVHVGRNISERKKAEESLIKSEQRYRAMLDKAPDAILIRDINGNVIDANPQAIKLFGYSRKELIGQNLSDIYSPEELDRARDGFNKMKHSKTARLDDTIIVRKDKQRVNIDVHASRFQVGDEVLVKSIFRDINEQKATQDQLKKAKTDLEATIVERTMELIEANTALKVLLSHQNKEKAENEEKLSMNLRKQIMPYIQELKKELSKEKRKAYIQLIEKNLQSVMSEFLTHLKSSASKLTPKEIQVASLIKEGMSTKEISKFLNVSRKTVDIFRYNIRKKLGLNNRKENLMNHLLSL